MLRLRTICLLAALLFALFVSVPNARAVELITTKQGRVLSGKVLVEAEDGGVLLQAADGRIWLLPKEEITARQANAKLFQALDRDTYTKQLLATLPPGFQTHKTKHYIICFNTSRGYAEWVGSLYERLYSGFYTYWPRKGAELKDPEFPLAVIVFDTRRAYEEYARAELGTATTNIIGYYSLQSNLVTTFDLTGLEEMKFAGDRNSPVRISKVLSQPNAERNVATIVHEATHQLAFNSGLQTRFSDTPFWVSEGLAVFFETPDLDSNRGWNSIGAVNRYNLINFRKYLRTREPGSLAKLLAEDKRFRDPANMADAYAEAWALNYYLIKTQGETYTKYLKLLAEQTPLVMQEPAERQEQFLKLFGGDLEKLEADFLRYMRNVE